MSEYKTAMPKTVNPLSGDVALTIGLDTITRAEVMELIRETYPFLGLTEDDYGGIVRHMKASWRHYPADKHIGECGDGWLGRDELDCNVHAYYHSRRDAPKEYEEWLRGRGQ